MKIIEGIEYLTTGDLAKVWNVPPKMVTEVIYHSHRLPEGERFPTPDIKNPTRHYWKASRRGILTRWWNQHNEALTAVQAATVETPAVEEPKEEKVIVEETSAPIRYDNTSEDTSRTITLDIEEAELLVSVLEQYREHVIEDITLKGEGNRELGRQLIQIRDLKNLMDMLEGH